MYLLHYLLFIFTRNKFWTTRFIQSPPDQMNLFALSIFNPIWTEFFIFLNILLRKVSVMWVSMTVKILDCIAKCYSKVLYRLSFQIMSIVLKYRVLTCHTLARPLAGQPISRMPERPKLVRLIIGCFYRGWGGESNQPQSPPLLVEPCVAW